MVETREKPRDLDLPYHRPGRLDIRTEQLPVTMHKATSSSRIRDDLPETGLQEYHQGSEGLEGLEVQATRLDIIPYLKSSPW